MLPWVMATLSANATARNETCTCLPLVFTCTHTKFCVTQLQLSHKPPPAHASSSTISIAPRSSRLSKISSSNGRFSSPISRSAPEPSLSKAAGPTPCRASDDSGTEPYVSFRYVRSCGNGTAQAQLQMQGRLTQARIPDAANGCPTCATLAELEGDGCVLLF